MKHTLIVLSCLILAALAADKILGHRTATNFPRSYTLGNAAPQDFEMTFLIALKQRNLDVLEKTFWDVSNPDSPQYRNFLTIEQIGNLVNPPREIKQKVISLLMENQVSFVEDRGDALMVKAKVSVLEKLFKTKFVEFIHVDSGSKIIRQYGEFSVPSQVADYIDMVSGLSEFPIPKYTVKRTSQKRGVLQGTPAIVPQSIQSYYGTGSARVSGQNISVGVIEFEDQYFSPTDLQNFGSSFSVPVTAVTASHTVGFNDPTNPQLEATLDIQYVLGVALNSVGWFWIEASNVWLYGFAQHLSSTQQVPWVNSISYGWNEEMQCEDGIGGAECQQLGVNAQQYVQRVNVEFQKIGVRGVSLICASGDSGANGRTDPYCSENHLNPVFPASSPFITSCGATQIDQNNAGNPLSNPPPGCSGYSCSGSGGYEEAVSYAQANFASGGGFSDVANVPSYQAPFTAQYLVSSVPMPPASYFNKNGRGFPDVAAFGSNVLISSGGSIEGVGGTSCASPIVAGIITLLNDYVVSKSGKPLGFLNPLLYKMVKDAPNTFHDITKGDNICTEDGCAANCKGFQATVGWDPVTGLGSPYYPAMKEYLAKFLNLEE